MWRWPTSTHTRSSGRCRWGRAGPTSSTASTSCSPASSRRDLWRLPVYGLIWPRHARRGPAAWAISTIWMASRWVRRADRHSARRRVPGQRERVGSPTGATRSGARAGRRDTCPRSYHSRPMDLVIALSQGLGLAAAAGLLAAAPLAVASTAAARAGSRPPRHSPTTPSWCGHMGAGRGRARRRRRVAGRAGGRSARQAGRRRRARVRARGGRHDAVHRAGGRALVAAAAAIAMRSVRAGAVKAGGDIRGTAMIEDGGGLVAPRSR